MAEEHADHDRDDITEAGVGAHHGPDEVRHRILALPESDRFAQHHDEQDADEDGD
jgi:hypothetical protein